MSEEKEWKWYYWLWPPVWIQVLAFLMQHLADWIADKMVSFFDQLDGRLVGGVLIGYVYADLTRFPKFHTVIVFILAILMAVFWDG